MTNITVLVSGGGTNLQALLDAGAAGKLESGRIGAVLSSTPGVYALERAAAAGIPGEVVSPWDFPDRDAFDRALCGALERHDTHLVVLAGYLAILGPRVLERYRDRILNVHPSLIPSFCGKGMYGLNVHRAALDYGVKVTGATVHLVSEVVDGGRILLQQAVAVREDDTPETLQRRVMEEAEWLLLPRAVADFCRENS